MKKLFAFLLLGVFMLSLASALEFDNVKDYDQITRTVTITNAFGLGDVITTAILESPDNVKVGAGDDKLVGWFNYITTEDDVVGSFGDLYLEDLKNGNQIFRGGQYKVKIYQEISVDDYDNVNCRQELNGTNYEEVCDWGEVGSHIETVSEWIPIINPNLNLLPNTQYEIGIFVDVEIGDHGDWEPTFSGKSVPEWSIWTADLNVNLVNYWKINEDSGTNTIEEIAGNNGTASTGAVLGGFGIIGDGADFTDATNIGVGSRPGDSTQAMSVSFWANITSGGWGLFFRGSSTNDWSFVVDPTNIRWDRWTATSGTTTLDFAKTITISTGDWHHVAMTKPSGTDPTIRLFLDGVGFDITSVGGAVGGGTGNKIGSRGDGGAGLVGFIDEIGVWDRELSDTEIVQLYNSGVGITYTDDPDTPPEITLNSPSSENFISPQSLTINFTASDDVNLTSVKLYVNNILNQTNTSGLNNTNYLFNLDLSEGEYTIYGTATNNESLETNSTSIQINIDATLPQIEIESPVGTLGYSYAGNNETLNVTFTDIRLDTCWYDYNGTNITMAGCKTGVKNSTQFILEIGNTNMTLYANDTFGNLNSTLLDWSYTYLENNRTHNNESSETEGESFNINVEGATSVALFYNGTEYTTTKSGNNFNRTIQVPVSQLGNHSIYWRFDDTQNSRTTYQNVSETVFTLCNSSYETRFLNISFKDEADSSVINASIPTSTFIYYLGDGTTTKTYNFINTSNNYNYEFCATPNKTLNVDSIFQYRQGTAYPQRVAAPGVIEYTNETTTTTLFLLGVADGIFVTFQTINTANQVISGVLITAIRAIAGEDQTVGVGTTGASGTVTFWLNPDFSHDFTFVKSGLPSISESFPPTQTAYTITMAAGTSTQNSTTRGVTYLIIPTNTFLENDTEYTFGFQLNSSFWDVDSYGFNLRLSNGTIIIGDSTTIEGTQLTISYNVDNQTLVYLDAFWIIDGNYTNATRYWAIQNTEYSGYSILVFFTDLNAYMDSGLFGIDDFGRYLIAFIILFISVGIMGQKFGISSPLGISTITFAIVFFLDVVTGILPSIRGISNLPTFIAGLILALSVLNEVRTR